jgi:hypothetical protein
MGLGACGARAAHLQRRWLGNAEPRNTSVRLVVADARRLRGQAGTRLHHRCAARADRIAFEEADARGWRGAHVFAPAELCVREQEKKLTVK